MEIKVLEKFSTVHDLKLFTGFYVDKIKCGMIKGIT